MAKPTDHKHQIPNTDLAHQVPQPGQKSSRAEMQTQNDRTIAESGKNNQNNLSGGEQTIIESATIIHNPSEYIGLLHAGELLNSETDTGFSSGIDLVVNIPNPGATIRSVQMEIPDDSSTATVTTGDQANLLADKSDQTAEYDYSRVAKSTLGGTKKNSIGRFEIQKVLGEGAFGKVYLARDVRLDRELAIKVAKTGVLNAKEDIDRFQREARAAARLRHPNIVPVHEAGSLGESNYIAYDFVRGTTIKQLLKEKIRFTPQECIPILVKIVEAINYAHEQGIIHRDIKPENIIVDDKQEPHVLDFGLARGTDLDVTHTREGAMMGSPAYMSPEQASGLSHLADQRSDIWSLGVMMYEMLAGQRPFQGSITEVIVAVKQKEAPPLKSLAPDVDLDLVTICEKCLRKNSSERFSHAGEMAEELHRWLRGEPIISRPLGIITKTTRWAKRNPTVALLIGGVCLSLIIGTFTSSYFAYEAIQGKRLVIETRKERDLAQLDNLVNGAPALFPQILELLKPHASEITPKLNDVLTNDKSTATQKLRSKTALLTLVPNDTLTETDACRLTCQEHQHLQPSEILSLSNYLGGSLKQHTNHYWKEVLDENTEPKRRFIASSFLASLDQNPARWEQISSDVVGQLLARNSQELHDWTKTFIPVKESLLLPLKLKFSTAETERERITAAVIIAQLFPENAELLIELILRSNSSQFPSLIEPLVKHRELTTQKCITVLEQPVDTEAGELRIAEVMRQQGNAACALIALGKWDAVRPYLKIRPDPRILTHLIHEASLAGINSEMIRVAINQEVDVEVLASLLAILSQYGSDSMPESDRRKLLPRLEQLYKTQLASGVKSQIEYLMRRWKFDEQLAIWQQSPVNTTTTANSTNKPGWFTNSRQLSFAVFTGPQQLTRGSPTVELGHAIGDIETQYRVEIPRSFAISTHEITVADYLKFQPDFQYEQDYSPLPQCPMHSVSWLDAAKYCRWLSEQEQIPEEEMCYPKIEDISVSMKLPKNFLERTGYRLPTSSEWEFACRGGSTRSRCYGDDPKLLPKYAWFNNNGEYRSHPVGSLLPNAYGIFDMHGNILEWTHDFYFDDLPQGAKAGIVQDVPDSRLGSDRELRGGHFESPLVQVRSADREYDAESMTSFHIGFRIAKTMR